MEESRTLRLHQLLRRLGEAVHGSVVRSDEVRSCLEEMREDGWRGVMLLEASVACREDGTLEVARGSMRLHVDADHDAAAYRIDIDDARFLSDIGISPSRHRSRGTHPRRIDRSSETEPSS